MSMSSFLATAKRVLTTPRKFFTKDVKRVKRWKDPATYLFVFTLLGAFFLIYDKTDVVSRIADRVMEPLGLASPSFQLGFWEQLLLYLAVFLFLFLFTNLKYWIAHWFVIIWNREAEFKRTYAVLTYGGTPGWLAMPFFLLATVTGAMAVSRGAVALWVVAVIAGLCWLALEGYSIYLRIYGLAQNQRITKWQAFLSVYVLGLLAYLVILVVFEAVLVLVLLLALHAAGAL
ncbi:MAG: YIP1 family protein [Candidatus Woesearchaeota archaeon]